MTKSTTTNGRVRTRRSSRISRTVSQAPAAVIAATSVENEEMSVVATDGDVPKTNTTATTPTTTTSAAMPRNCYPISRVRFSAIQLENPAIRRFPQSRSRAMLGKSHARSIESNARLLVSARVSNFPTCLIALFPPLARHTDIRISPSVPSSTLLPIGVAASFPMIPVRPHDHCNRAKMTSLTDNA